MGLSKLYIFDDFHYFKLYSYQGIYAIGNYILIYFSFYIEFNFTSNLYVGRTAPWSYWVFYCNYTSALNKTSCILYLEIGDGNYQIILHDFRLYVNGT